MDPLIEKSTKVVIFSAPPLRKETNKGQADTADLITFKNRPQNALNYIKSVLVYCCS